MKLDIAQFFLSGTLHDLVRDATKGLAGNAKALTTKESSNFCYGSSMCAADGFQEELSEQSGAREWG